MKFLAKFVGTSFGFGYAPIAPGTFGTVFGVLIYLSLVFYTDWNINFSLLALIVMGTLVGTWACTILMKEWGHDPSKIVMDESVGVWISLLFVPFNWWYVLLAFVLFRFFDILKPLGIKSVDEGMNSAFSVMLDDIIAGIYTWISLQAIIYIIEAMLG